MSSKLPSVNAIDDAALADVGKAILSAAGVNEHTLGALLAQSVAALSGALQAEKVTRDSEGNEHRTPDHATRIRAAHEANSVVFTVGQMRGPQGAAQGGNHVTINLPPWLEQVREIIDVTPPVAGECQQ